MRRLGYALFLLALSTMTAACQLIGISHGPVTPHTPVVLHGGNGVEELTLKNVGKRRIALKLSSGVFTDSFSQIPLTGPKIIFVPESGAGKLPRTLGAGKTLVVLAQISGVTGTSSAKTWMLNGDTEVEELQTIADDAPLNLSIDGEGGEDKKLNAIQGKPVYVTLKNSDAEAYQVDLFFQVEGKPVPTEPKTLLLPAKSAARVEIKPDEDDYSKENYVHPTEKTGSLTWKLHDEDSETSKLLSTKSLPVHLVMMKTTPEWSSRLGFLYSAFILFMGSIFNVLGSWTLPNNLKKASLRSQIDELADRTSSVSTRVDSYLRVLLRLERGKIKEALDRANPLYPTFADDFDSAASAIALLKKRLVIAEHLDELRRTFEEISVTAPPSVTDEIDQKLQAAATYLHAFTLQDEDLRVANDLLTKAEDCLKRLDDSEALATLIAGNFKKLQDRMRFFKEEDYRDLKQALERTFDLLKKPYDDPSQITSRMFFSIDHGIAALQTALDYVMVRASVARPPEANCPETGKEARKRLVDHECELLELLGTLSWRALSQARTLVQQMREDVYEQDILNALVPHQSEIVFDTQVMRPFRPIYFSVAFKDRRLNGAAAITELTSMWDFPDRLSEVGWKVCHYFQKDKSRHGEGQNSDVTVSVSGQKDLEIRKLSRSIVLQDLPPRQHSRWWASGLRFAIAYGAALAGLVSGALVQLNKLDFLPATIAILALGFSADSIKNLLTQAPKKSLP